MPAAPFLPAIEPDHATRIGRWCDALARACAATEPWRLHGWARGAAAAIGALSARRIECSVRLDGAPADGRVDAGSVGDRPAHRAWLRSRPAASGRAGAATVAADAATACRGLHRGLLDDPSRAAPRLAGLVLASLRVRDEEAAAPSVELVLLGPRASVKPFTETVVRGEALHDTLRALASLAGILRAQLTADTQAPWADLDRIGRVCSAADRDEAFVELAWHLLDDILGPSGPRTEPGMADGERHRLLRADGELLDDARLELPMALAGALPAPAAARRDAALPLDAPTAGEAATPGKARPPDGVAAPDGLPPHDDAPTFRAGDDEHDGLDASRLRSDPSRDLHLDALSMPFRVDPAAAAEAGLDTAEIERLARFGTWYERLADGRLMPDSAAQHHFVLAAKGRAEPVGEHERLWRGYRTAVRRLAMSTATATATATPSPTPSPMPRPTTTAMPVPAPIPRTSPPAKPAIHPAEADGPPTMPMPVQASASERATVPSASSRMLLETLERATTEELLELTRALDGQESASAPLATALLTERIGTAGRSGLTTAATLGRASYLEMLRDAAEAIGADRVWWTARTGPTGVDLASIDAARGTALRDPSQRDAAAALQAWVDELETEVLRSILGMLQLRLAPTQRTRLAQAVVLRAGRHGIDLSDSVTPGGDLSVLHLGGFATYTALSTALGFVAAALPALSGYALASSLLGAMLGPAGRPVLGDAPAGRAIGPNARRVLRLVATVAMIRQGAAASAPQGVPRRMRDPAPA